LKGNVLGQPVQMALELALPSKEPSHDAIPSIWARQRIRQIWNHNVGNETPQSRSEITELGLRHQLVTQYTSFVAVEKELSEVPQGKLISENIPGMTPEGMAEKQKRVPRTNASTTAAPAQPASNEQSTANQPAAQDSTSNALASQTTAPAAPRNPTSTRPSGTFRRGSGGSSSGSPGGGPIGPFTALFSIAGAGAAAMLRRKKAEGQTEPMS
ncbi:MAG: alpha-1-antitrypsin, partial [Rubripirellula sp.]|nr:alpha-1-antitrypsin [Rubripirellula sp.]